MMWNGRSVKTTAKCSNCDRFVITTKKNSFPQDGESETNRQREERRMTRENEDVAAVEDVEKLRDAMTDWFVGVGALPNQDVIAVRTSDQLRFSDS